jgi:spermidine synthase
MSDTPAELEDMYYFVYHAKGKVLINGLGLGAAVQAVLSKPEVEHVTVIEISEDVIKLVADHYLKRYGDRLTIIHADALTWQPPKGQKFDTVWHDIWDSICTDNLEEMGRLHRRYGKRAAWQASWCREQCEYYRGRDY